MKGFLKENVVLVVGISLPLLLTFLFFLATQIDKINVEPPQYSIIFATNYFKNNSNYPYRIFIDDNQVRYTYTPPEKDRHYHINNKPRLYVYNPATNKSIELTLPDYKDRNNPLNVPVQDLEGKEFSTTKESPDGYVLEYERRGGGNLMTQMFRGGYRSRANHILKKDGHRVRVPQAQNYNVQFIGWIIDEP